MIKFGKIFKKLLLLAFILFLFSFLVFSLTPLLGGKPSSLLDRIGSFLPVLIYLFIYLFWIFFLTTLIFHFIVSKLKLNSISTYIISSLLSVIIGLYSFNFGNIIDRDYDKMNLSGYLIVFLIFHGFLMSFLYSKYLKINNN